MKRGDKMLDEKIRIVIFLSRKVARHWRRLVDEETSQGAVQCRVNCCWRLDFVHRAVSQQDTYSGLLARVIAAEDWISFARPSPSETRSGLLARVIAVRDWISFTGPSPSETFGPTRQACWGHWVRTYAVPRIVSEKSIKLIFLND
jgi:hypothetical protein